MSTVKPHSDRVDSRASHAKLLTGNLSLLVALEANGADQCAAELEAKIEAGLARRPKVSGPITADRVELPASERGQSPDQVARFEKAKRALSNPMTKPRARDTHARALAAIENAPREAQDAAWLDRSKAETVALAEARGEDVETKDGRVNVTSRDSLLNLIKAGKLTPDQAKAGRDCRDAYEIRAQSLGAMNYSDTGRGGRDHEACIAWGISKANASLMMPFVERFIQLRHHAEPMALTLFRAILAERHTIADHGASQSVRERNTAAFILALDAAVDGLEAWKRVRGR